MWIKSAIVLAVVTPAVWTTVTSGFQSSNQNDSPGGFFLEEAANSSSGFGCQQSNLGQYY